MLGLMELMILVFALLGVAGGGAAVWLAIGRARLAAELSAARSELVQRSDALARAEAARNEREAEAAQLRADAVQARADLHAALDRHTQELEHAERLSQERLAAVQREKAAIEKAFTELRTQAAETFRSLAAEALSKSSQDFLNLAEVKLKAAHQAGAAELEKRKQSMEHLVQPIAETLKKTDEKLAAIQGEWAEDRGRLAAEIKSMGAAGELLRSETGRLVRALSKPEVRGRYGEIQLKRVAELAGMKDYCDFAEQSSQRDDEGRLVRPDMVVRLPNERIIAVDAKTNTYAYVEAVNAATPEEQEVHLERFARHVCEQVGALSKKQYWAKFEASPDFVVMFVPGDQFLDAALARRPDLLEQAASASVLLATPSTLIGLLRAVAVGWREKRLDQQAAELFALGRELHERASRAFGLMVELGGSLDRAVKKYNELVGSYQSRLEPTLRRFEEAGARSGKELPDVKAVEVSARVVDDAGLLPQSAS
jgi:DNA recombination protein RmuC